MADRKILQDCRNELFGDIVEFRKLFGNRSLDDVMMLIEKKEKELGSYDLYIQETAKSLRQHFDKVAKGIGTPDDFLKNEFAVDGILDDYEVIAERFCEVKESVTKICQAIHQHAEMLALVEDNTPMGRFEPSIKDYEITISTDEEPYGLNAYRNDVIKHEKEKRARIEQIMQSSENLAEETSESSKYKTM